MRLVRLIGIGIALGLALHVQAADQGIVLAEARAGVFHHLDASGRNSLAVSGNSTALVWEDNRSGAPACYLALKTDAASKFSEFGFGQGECFEPAVAAFDAQRFLLIWEDAEGVHTAIADPTGIGPATRLAASGGQGNLTVHPQLGAYAAWSATDSRWRRIWLAPLQIDANRVSAATPLPIDPAPATDDQTFPGLAAGAHNVMLAWEDRRHGHTVIFGSHTRDGKNWSAPTRLSGNPTGRQAGDLGRGSGAMRPALAAFGTRIAAIWLDKRDFLSGYDVYAALSDPDSPRFEADRKAQDSFGDAIAQWHAAAAGNRQGELVIGWDDDRDGTADIWLTRLSGADYSEDFTLPALSGPARQSDPALALDEQGNLHLAWIERDDGDATRLRYLRWPLPPH